MGWPPDVHRSQLPKQRALTPDQDVAIWRAWQAGVSVTALAREYDRHPRAMYRAIARAARNERHTWLTWDGWRAAFVMGVDGPRQVTPWYPT